jgi:hypothetical protein
LVYWLPQIVKGVATEIGLDKLTGVSINALTAILLRFLIRSQRSL